MVAKTFLHLISNRWATATETNKKETACRAARLQGCMRGARGSWQQALHSRDDDLDAGDALAALA
eukprot:5235713-Prymnesium_polylepis.1